MTIWWDFMRQLKASWRFKLSNFKEAQIVKKPCFSESLIFFSCNIKMFKFWWLIMTQICYSWDLGVFVLNNFDSLFLRFYISIWSYHHYTVILKIRTTKHKWYLIPYCETVHLAHAMYCSLHGYEWPSAIKFFIFTHV